MLPGASLGRLHAEDGGDRPSDGLHGISESRSKIRRAPTPKLGLFARCPELAKQVIHVINISRLQSSYRLRFAPDGQNLEWLAIDDEGEVVLSQEPEATLFLLLQNMLLTPFVPEQLL